MVVLVALLTTFRYYIIDIHERNSIIYVIGIEMPGAIHSHSTYFHNLLTYFLHYYCAVWACELTVKRHNRNRAKSIRYGSWAVTCLVSVELGSSAVRYFIFPFREINSPFTYYTFHSIINTQYLSWIWFKSVEKQCKVTYSFFFGVNHIKQRTIRKTHIKPKLFIAMWVFRLL